MHVCKHIYVRRRRQYAIICTCARVRQHAKLNQADLTHHDWNPQAQMAVNLQAGSNFCNLALKARPSGHHVQIV